MVAVAHVRVQHILHGCFAGNVTSRLGDPWALWIDSVADVVDAGFVVFQGFGGRTPTRAEVIMLPVDLFPPVAIFVRRAGVIFRLTRRPFSGRSFRDTAGGFARVLAVSFARVLCSSQMSFC